MRLTQKILMLLLALSVLSGLTACSYKIEIQQGNNALLDNVDKLTVGMQQAEILELLGPPQGDRLFRDNIWLYAYQIRESGFLDSPKWLTVELTFDDSDKLTDIKRLRDDYAEQ